MKRILSFALSIILALSLLCGCSRTEEFTFCPDIAEGDISVVSFNVAAPWGSVANNTLSSSRVKRFAAYMNAVKPDIIGTQEMNSSWLEELGELMPDYDCYGVARGGDENEKKSEINAIFWLKDKYEWVEKNTFWLSETPDEESRYQGAGCNRICSYVMLRDKETDEYILHLNTHLDNASDEAREFGAQVIMDKLKEIRMLNAVAYFTVVLTGDFNCELDSSACQIISEELNTHRASEPTYHDWGNINEGEPIDFIFTDGEIEAYTVLDDTTNGYVSDHYGVYQTISIK